jgi:glycogen operon protein
MMLAGDEFGRTQQGNNNAYCQDNEISWTDWDHHERGELLTRFVQRLMHLRNRYAVLRRNRFLTGEWNEEQGIKDATWLAPRGAGMSLEQWQESGAKCVGLLLDGRAQSSGIPKRGSEATLLVVVNAHHDVVVFELPDVRGGRDWLRLVDTNLPEEDEDLEDALRFEFKHSYEVTGHSLLLFLLRPARLARSAAASKPAE